MHIVLARVLQAALVLLAIGLWRVLAFVVRCFNARRAFKACTAPGPPLPKLFIGHVTSLAGIKGPFNLVKWANQYGPLYKVQLLDSLSVVVTDPETITRIARRTGPGPYLPKPRELYRPLERALKPAMQNILTAEDGPYWKAVRQGAAPCFSSTNLKKIMPLVLRLTHRVADRMSDAISAGGGSSGTFDVSDGAKRITSDVMGHMLMGEDLQGTLWQPSEYLDLFYPVLEAQAALLNNPVHLWQLWDRGVRHQRSCLSKHNDLMDAKVKGLMANPPEEHTIAAHLLAVKDPATGRQLAKDQLKAEIATFMAAGFETTSHAITWTLAALAAHPDVQDKLVQELQDAQLVQGVAGAAREIDMADIGNLSYLGAVVKEVLRVCPPAPWGGTKVANGDIELCGYAVPKGTFVMIPLLPLSLAHHNYGDTATQFLPERWLISSSSNGDDSSSNASQQQLQQSGFLSLQAGAGGEDDLSLASAPPAGNVQGSVPDPLSFLTGPRDCIGQSLAKLELQVVVTTLLARFRFYPGPKLEAELKVAAATGQPAVSAVHALSAARLTLQPADGQLLLRIEHRQ